MIQDNDLNVASIEHVSDIVLFWKKGTKIILILEIVLHCQTY